MKEPKQYYWNGSYVTIVGNIEGEEGLVAVDEGSDYGSMSVARRADLIPKEESYTYKRAQERADELRLLVSKAQDKFDTLVDEIVDEACKTLSMRIKMNALFGHTGNGALAVQISEEVEKLIKKDPKEIVEKKVKASEREDGGEI